MKINKYVSDLTVRLGPITVKAALLPVRKSATKTGAPKFVYSTPDGHPVHQRYVDDTGSIWEIDGLTKSIVTKNEDGEQILTPVVKEVIEGAKESTLPKNVVNLTAHPSDQVDAQTFVSDNNAYVLQPHNDDPANVQWYELLRKIIADAGFSFVALANVRNSEGVYRLTCWRGYIVLQRLIYPEEINEHPVLDDPVIDPVVYTKAMAMLDKLVAPFDSDNYRNTQAERLRVLQNQALSGEIPVPVIDDVPVKSFDLLAALDAFEAMAS